MYNNYYSNQSLCVFNCVACLWLKFKSDVKIYVLIKMIQIT